MKKKFKKYVQICVFFVFAFVVNITTFSSLVYSTPSLDFTKWVENFKKYAIRQGISERIVHNAFKKVKFDSTVINLARNQPEFTLSFNSYYHRVISLKRILEGHVVYLEHKKLLHSIARKYNVDPFVVLAIYGIETSYGHRMGKRSIIQSLVSLAYKDVKKNYARKQLIYVLKIIQNDNIIAKEMRGSWAGAMGKTQFIPSTYFNYAVDFNHDGKKDLFHSTADALASTANYLKKRGHWKGGVSWGFRAKFQNNKNIHNLYQDLTHSKTIQQWKKIGVVPAEHMSKKLLHKMLYLVMPDSKNSPNTVYLVTQNFKAIMTYNTSTYYALAVGLLSERLSKYNNN